MMLVDLKMKIHSQAIELSPPEQVQISPVEIKHTLLKGLSAQIRSAREWYHWINLGLEIPFYWF
jgi:hypothetical protein